MLSTGHLEEEEKLKSRPKRIEAAKLSKSIVDSLKQIDKKAKVIIMGDFNDDPISPSIKDFLKARGSTVLNNNQMYNAMYDHFKRNWHISLQRSMEFI